MNKRARKYIKGQSLAEIAVVSIVFVVAILVMSKYVKNSLRGRWKTSAESGFGQAFDPKESNFKTVYKKSGDTINAIVMEKEVLNSTHAEYDPKSTNEVWYQMSYQAAGEQGIQDIDGDYIVANDTNRRSLVEMRSEKSELTWKEMGE